MSLSKFQSVNIMNVGIYEIALTETNDRDLRTSVELDCG